MNTWMMAGALIVGSAMLAPGAIAAPTCSVVVDTVSGQVLHRAGECDTRESPASSFKVPLAAMGFASGALKDAHAPVWKYKPEYDAWMEAWKQDVDPTSWLRDSVVWYSQELTRKMGMTAFQGYLDAWSYGNRDATGDAGKNNGLTHAWLSSSLAISPDEQVAFLRRLQQQQLGLPQAVFAHTQAAMPTFPVKPGWTLYGKTGSGFQKDAKGAIERARQFGWFVGWATNGKRTVTFARLVRDDSKTEGYGGPRARDGMLKDLPAWLPAD